MKEKSLKLFSHNLLIPILLVFMSFLVRIISFHFFHFISSDGGTDSVVYAITGRNIFSGKGFIYDGLPQLEYPPFYPFLIGLSWIVTKDLEFSGQFISLIAGGLLVIPCYYLSRAFYGKSVSILGSLFVIFNPLLIYWSTETFSESLYTLLLFASLATGWQTLKRHGLHWPLLTGMFIGLSYLTRPEGFLVGMVFLVLLLSSRYWLSGGINRIVPKIAVFLIVFFSFSLPYILYIHHHTGKWTISTKAAAFATESRMIDEQGREKTLFQILSASGPSIKRSQLNDSPGLLHDILSDPIRISKRVYENSKDVVRILLGNRYSEILTYFTVLFLVLKGFLNLSETKKEIFLILMMFSNFAFLLFDILGRYLFPFYPVMNIWMAAAIFQVREVTRKEYQNKISAILITSLILFSLLYSVKVCREKAFHAPIEYKIMGLWMRNNIKDVENKIVMARKLGVPFYAGAKWHQIFYGEYPGLIEYLNNRSIDYLVIDERTTPRYRPQFAFLLEEEKEHQGLKVVHTVKYKDRKAVLYQLKR